MRRVLKKKRIIIILAVILAALVLWLCINPPGRFGFCTFAYITYNSIPRPLSDLQVRSDGKTRSVEKTHDLKLQHVEWLLTPKPQVIIIGTGWDGVTKPRPDIRAIPDCDLRILKTEEAIKLFNQLKRERKKVAIHVHSTC
jgi:hypothetical protein